MNLWSGRFSKELDTSVNDFNSSIAVDSRMAAEDIAGSIAHATMLAACGILTEADKTAIVAGLSAIATDLESGALLIDPHAEDIHMFVEEQLTQRIGQAGKRLHTARSRNDQVATDTRLYLMKKNDQLSAAIYELIEAIITLAEQHLETVMPGYTHLQVAQPITFAHHIMAYAQMLRRDLERLADCKRRTSSLPLGACALAGTTHPIDRALTAQLLGFDAVCQNSLDAVSDRDFCTELAFVLSMVMTHLSRFSEEIILWCSCEFGFIELDDAFATGSSIMPQKKNPDITELIRGKTGRVTGSLMALLTMLKGLPLAYNKDMQEDKEAVFNCIDTTLICLTTFTPMLRTMRVRANRMRQAASKGFINATDCADYLAKRDVPFREAYKITGALVAHCIEAETTLEALPLTVFQRFCPVFEADVFAAIDLNACVNGRAVLGGPAPIAVQQQIAQLKGCLTALEVREKRGSDLG